jgi:hypothetical protein
MKPDAYYDTLAISAKLAISFESVAPSEIHLFAYLSCLLSLYRGKAASDWGYGFVATANGSPYSPEVADALRFLVREGYLYESNGYLTIISEGLEDYRELGELLRNQEREPFLNGSCGSVLAMPIGLIREAISTDHDMKVAPAFGDTRGLLTDSNVEDLHDAFALLSEQIGVDVNDLMVPAVVWLNYLSQIGEVTNG